MTIREDISKLELELTTLEDANSPDSPLLIEPLEKLAYAHHLIGDYNEAEVLYKRAMLLRENFQSADVEGLIYSAHSQAILMRIQNRFAEAEPHYIKAIELSKRHLGANHLDTAMRRNYLAGLYFAWGRFDLAEQLVDANIALYRGTLGDKHEVVGVVAMGLCLIANRQGLSQEAGEYFKLADKLLPAGPRAAIVLDFKDLAASLFFLSKEKFKQGQIEEAETLYRYSLIIETDRLWPGHRIVGDNVQLLGDLYRSQYMAVEAEFLYRKAYEIRRATMGEEHLDVAVSAHSLGTLLFDNRRFEEAATFLMVACDIRGKAGFPPLLANSLRAYAACLRQLNRNTDADECEQKARNIFERYNPV
ncbi:MAG: tetratricopeptide repeat protein [Candidatus Obscuribacterales bacterium]|nr:tetratricopeptide repeat protein [Candidatus Obscuribacterales bacterium]